MSSRALTKNTIALEFLWVDGRGANQVMARALAKKAFRTKFRTLDGVKFAQASFTKDQFLLASQVFQLIGRKNTTKIMAHGYPTLNKSRLARVFDCYETALRSRAKDYCGITISEPRPATTDLQVSVSIFGISAPGMPPAGRSRPRARHPCRLCYYSTAPRPESPSEWATSIAPAADESHAILCPRFKF